MTSFAEEFLGFRLGETLAAEEKGTEGRPDFTPADSVTHPFVFEVKSTRAGVPLRGYGDQVQRYLDLGRPRIQQVVLTNLVGLKVFVLDDHGHVMLDLEVDMRGLLYGDEAGHERTASARDLSRFIWAFRYQELTTAQKLERVRSSARWNPIVATTSSSWVLGRIDRVVKLLTTAVDKAVRSGALRDERTTTGERSAILGELQDLATRLSGASSTADLGEFLAARPESLLGAALRQYCGHVAYYATTRLLLVRIWEDLGLLDETLHDGGFDQKMQAFNDVVRDVVAFAFSRAHDRYRALFDQRNNYTWFTPTEPTYADVIYELANTYFGEIESDILGEVYERLLERIDRKLLGQYYTPRDVIRLIWDLVNYDELASELARFPKVLDIATGSGGFLVEPALRARRALRAATEHGSTIDRQEWLREVAGGLVGVELQRFSSYLAELNLLVQVGQVAAYEPTLRLPSLGIIHTDTLSLHDHVPTDDHDMAGYLSATDPDAVPIADQVSAGPAAGHGFDVAVGNPPYIGQKVAADLIRMTRTQHPYWDQYIGHHMDYLYWFLILGVSKLRGGGRFGFITTEYWLRAIGAKPLRRYLAAHTIIERLVLLRNFRPFPDAPGQHSLLVIGRRLEPEESVPARQRPTVSIFTGETVDQAVRTAMLDAIREGRNTSGVKTFTGSASPNALGEESWSTVVMTAQQARRRRRLLARSEALAVEPEQGVLSSANRMRASYAQHLTQGTLLAIGWPDRSHGIFVLTDAEAREFGRLTQAEQKLLRRFVNTGDVLPYAAVLPDDASWIIYLTAPDSAHRNTPFPAGLPAIERHITRFKPLLEHKVSEYGEDRPWWRLHRARPEIVQRDGTDARWADYCVTANWGQGGSLVVGLPPRGAVPAQGLNAILTPHDVAGAYLCGVMNSTPIQELAETLPPGYLRGEDFHELNMPFLPDLAVPIAACARELADLVAQFCALERSFPGTLHQLRADIALAGALGDAWLFTPGAPPQTGNLSTVRWASVNRSGRGGGRVRTVEVTHTLFGLNVIAAAGGGPSVSVELAAESEHVADALASYFRGHAASGGKLGEIPFLPMPLTGEDLVAAAAADAQQLNQVASTYRDKRAWIDAEMAAVI